MTEFIIKVLINRHFSECFDNPSESSELADSIPDTNGLFFVPAFCGLQAPVNDPTAAAGLIGKIRH
jgi:putative glycerol kinase 5